MKRLAAVIALVFSLSLLIQTPILFFSPTVSAEPLVDPPTITGEAAYLIDVETGQTLYSKNGDLSLAPASTTKIMTGLLAIELGNLQDTVTASETMLDYNIVYGTRIYLEPGEKLTLDDMLYALLLNSANDAAVAIAEHIGGDIQTFVDLMNQKAAQLGLKNTTFKNPSGLNEEGHLTTSHDLARLALAAYGNAKYREYIKTKSHVIDREKTEGVPIEMFNENKLLWRDERVTGMKTGYTSVAKNCLVVSAKQDGRELIGVILKSPGREIYTDMQALLDYGFEQFENVLYKGGGETVGEIEVQGEVVNLILSEPLWLTQNQDNTLPQTRITIVPTQETLTEVTAGQVLSYLEVWEGEDCLKRIPLTADRTVVAEKPSEGVKSFGLYTGLGMIFSGVILYGAVQQKKHTQRRRARALMRKERQARNAEYYKIKNNDL